MGHDYSEPYSSDNVIKFEPKDTIPLPEDRVWKSCLWYSKNFLNFAKSSKNGEFVSVLKFSRDLHQYKSVKKFPESLENPSKFTNSPNFLKLFAKFRICVGIFLILAANY